MPINRSAVFHFVALGGPCRCDAQRNTFPDAETFPKDQPKMLVRRLSPSGNIRESVGDVFPLLFWHDQLKADAAVGRYARDEKVCKLGTVAVDLLPHSDGSRKRAVGDCSELHLFSSPSFEATGGASISVDQDRVTSSGGNVETSTVRPAEARRELSHLIIRRETSHRARLFGAGPLARALR